MASKLSISTPYYRMPLINDSARSEYSEEDKNGNQAKLACK
jgi:hypothetical protein